MKKYGKILLSAYIMKKIKPGKSRKSKGILNKYGTLALGAYALNKLKSEETEKEVEEMELSETGRRTSRMSTGKILKGALAGATIVGAIAGVTALYSYKKYQSKRSIHKIQVE